MEIQLEYPNKHQCHHEYRNTNLNADMDESILLEYGFRMIGDVDAGGSESGSTHGLCDGALVLKQSSALSHIISAGVDARLFCLCSR